MGEQSASRLFSRSRRENVQGGRGKSVHLRMTADEHAAFTALAAAQRVSVQRYLIEAGRAGGSSTITARRQLGFDLTEVRRLLATIANNANQVAKYANSEGAVAQWADDVAADYERLRPLLNAMVSELSKR